jgi:heme/copper-type cytochrome/quinol oxidase subunit 1
MGAVPVFAVIGGLHYWFPKMTGRMMHRSLAIWSFWVLFVGFNLTFFPMHAMGLSGMPRRMHTYAEHPGWELMNQLATLGSFVLSIGILMVLWNCLSSLRTGRVAGNDPWGGYTLEWYTTSPPPDHNFDDLPPVRSERPLYDLRRDREHRPTPPEVTVG